MNGLYGPCCGVKALGAQPIGQILPQLRVRIVKQRAILRGKAHEFFLRCERAQLTCRIGRIRRHAAAFRLHTARIQRLRRRKICAAAPKQKNAHRVKQIFSVQRRITAVAHQQPAGLLRCHGKAEAKADIRLAAAGRAFLGAPAAQRIAAEPGARGQRRIAEPTFVQKGSIVLRPAEKHLVICLQQRAQIPGAFDPLCLVAQHERCKCIRQDAASSHSQTKPHVSAANTSIPSCRESFQTQPCTGFFMSIR